MKITSCLCLLFPILSRMADRRGIKITPIAILRGTKSPLGKWLGMTWIRSKLIYIYILLRRKKCQIILINPHIFIQNSILKTFHSFFDKPLITSTYHSESYYTLLLSLIYFETTTFLITFVSIHHDWQIPLTFELTIHCLLGLTKCYM